MSSNMTDPASTPTVDPVSPDSKGKGKAPVQDQPMNENVENADEGDEEEEEADDDDEIEEEEEVEESYEEIDPTAIVSGRRTRAPVDYTSKEAFEKAGLKPDDADDDEDEDVHMG
ncbi:hypothetical protein AGABI2DRAFT_154611 [Agaricus bisporus var. bisporus H97]|uniref:hypothetical protein n=1 Tax=Agaricus bisporus var. bisporus (strain H97 / ATCC MYA-4626 / FGSC 10389) TaxID=936046 RepID=UPI00029F5149|nr:hypothetical protein AGABI2DRAFT_154611 [Agaricus bisporus var. bisporus H97]EKV42066.1 hypothetical protein AGABI2DRAFT_154611 [Agaricus bisporus var. bisporus H97]